MYRLDVYSGPSLLRTLCMNRPLLYSICCCFCRLIILISFNFWSVIRFASWKFNFIAPLCREFLFEDIATSIPHDWYIINVRFNTGTEEQFPGVDVYHIPYTVVLTEGSLDFRLFCIHYQYASPNEVYWVSNLFYAQSTSAVISGRRFIGYAWLYLKDGVPTFDIFSSRVERGRVVRVTAVVSGW